MTMKLAPLNAPAAYRIGWDAARRGEPITVNPYTKRKYNRQFREGWTASKEANAS